ncbi:hypothetical protein ACLQ16_03915 [Streptomyces albidoflavus]|uniref:hypothetical protein n=1 Tax=Streptomyces albidoflavus TaxID=1886 RepID=UPI003CEFD721
MSRTQPEQPTRTRVAPSASKLQHARPGVVSRDAANVADILLRLPPTERRNAFKHHLTARERAVVMTEVERATGSLYGLWRDSPSGFVEDVLGESLWSKQRAVLDAIVDHKRVAVPAGFGVGKTHLAARAAVWFTNVYPVGTALCITTATRFRQVQRQLWPHIRKVVPRAGLPGYCDTVQYKMPDPYGNDFVAAYGFSAPANDEAAMQGIHMPHLLLIVDEAGGIAPMIGHGTNNLLTGGHAAMLAIGNPAMDDPASWFEELCIEGDDPSEPTTVTIPISSLDSPAITGELAPYCTDCPEGVARHSLADHMPDQDWVDRTIRSYGEEHPYVIAKVYARFPKGGGGIASRRAGSRPPCPTRTPPATVGTASATSAWRTRRPSTPSAKVPGSGSVSTLPPMVGMNSPCTALSVTRWSSGTLPPALPTTTRCPSPRSSLRRFTPRSASPMP